MPDLKSLSLSQRSKTADDPVNMRRAKCIESWRRGGFFSETPAISEQSGRPSSKDCPTQSVQEHQSAAVPIPDHPRPVDAQFLGQINLPSRHVLLISRKEGSNVCHLR